jgi:hypothetical protein
MARAIRFHLDEVCDPRIAATLRQRSVDVTTAVDAGLLGGTDEEHLAFGGGQGRIIATHDADFLRLHRAGSIHAGIIYWPVQARSLGDTIRVLVLTWEVLEPHEMYGHVEHL